MIIEKQEDVTTAVLAELKRAPNARFREIMSADMAARRLVNYANLRGGTDNTTVVVVRAC